MTEQQYRGKCPLYSAPLAVSEGGDYLTCTFKPHYSTSRAKYENHWLMYDEGKIDALGLLKALIVDNLMRTGKHD